MWYIILSDRQILTPETVMHGLHITIGPYASHEDAANDIDHHRMTLKKTNKALYKRMFPISAAVFAAELTREESK